MSEVHKGKVGYWRGKHRSKETIRKIGEAHKGKHYSPKTEFKKGLTPWNKGKTGVYSKEITDRSRERILRMYASGKFPATP